MNDQSWYKDKRTKKSCVCEMFGKFLFSKIVKMYLAYRKIRQHDMWGVQLDCDHELQKTKKLSKETKLLLWNDWQAFT